MCKFNQSDQSRKRGFTLVELLLVIVILGILAGVVVTNVTDVGNEARTARVKTDISSIQTAVRTYEIYMGKYPSDDEGIEELSKATDEHKAFLEKIPKDPWGNPYSYREESENGLSGPDVWSNGPDGQEGTDDDIGNWDVESEEGGESSSGTSGTSSSSSSGTAE